MPNTAPGKSDSATQTLKPGKYYAADLESNGVAEFEVTGDGKDQVEAPAATIDATEYAFKAVGAQGRQVRGAVRQQGRPAALRGRAADERRARRSRTCARSSRRRRASPRSARRAASTRAVSEGDRKQVVNLDLKKGKYALVCFIPDRQGGPPHVVKGMISEAVVE